jgi:regulation of enolase protein 1 (concanavalin A-like superfamily)
MGRQSSASDWVSLGEVANGGTFDDTLSGGSVDARWYLVGSGAKAISSHAGVRLMSTQDEAALLQSAPAGDATVSTTITMTPDAAASTQAGLVLYLDDGDWITLLTNRKGTVSFCAELAYQTSPCFTQAASNGTSPHSITVRISRTSANFTGSFSVDGAAWQTVGTWVPIAPSNPAAAGSTTGVPSLTPTATATSGTSQTLLIAPISFSSCGVLSVGSASLSEALLLSDFQVVAAPSS